MALRDCYSINDFKTLCEFNLMHSHAVIGERRGNGVAHWDESSHNLAHGVLSVIHSNDRKSLLSFGVG